jgi:vitamin K-dependent gamma-carboxylase
MDTGARDFRDPATRPSVAWFAALPSRAREPVDPAALVAFRVLFGLLGVIAALRFLAHGWVARMFVEPTFHFRYFGFGWVRALPEPWTTMAFVALAVLAACVALGFAYRVAAPLYFLLFSYLELVDVTNYLNHYYLVSLLALLLSVLPLHRAGSLDARLWPALRVASFPRWMLWLLRFQVGVVYVGAGLAKLQPDWLLHGQPLGIWLAARTHLPLVGPWLNVPAVALAMSWGGFLYDLTLPLWLSLRRTRPFAYLAAILFHGAVGVLFQIGMFPLIMVVAATVFFEPSWPRAWLTRLAPRALEAFDARGPAVRPLAHPAWRGAAQALLAAYCAVQIALPLRSTLYGGDVLWHEQGMRWSWRVMVREKNGSVSFRVRMDGDARERIVSPRRYLTSVQEREMSTQPDLILQLAHHIAAELRAAGHRDVEVRADALVSLNGRAPARLLDPRVDLAQVDDGFAPAPWILPAPAEPPIRLRRPRGPHRPSSAVALGERE